MSAQSEEVSITEEDLELIKERETNIRQLEVGSSPLVADQQLTGSILNLLLSTTRSFCWMWWTEEHTQLQRVWTGTPFMSSHLQTGGGKRCELHSSAVSSCVSVSVAV